MKLPREGGHALLRDVQRGLLGLTEICDAHPELMRAAQKGVMHPKTASRKVSRLAARIKSMGN